MDELRRIADHDIDSGRYRSYMVRLWREAPGDPWRCQVSCVGTVQEQRSASPAELFDFLVADAAERSEGTGRNAETSDVA